jgi:TetR/AcrR family transcriptional repressor of nem operon
MDAPLLRDTAVEILAIASRLVQTRGFNGFSYADVAAELRVSKASLHYHFASKAELGRRLIERYEREFAAALVAIDEEVPAAAEKLRRYVQIYEDVLQADRMCLCGMLAAEYGTLPSAMQASLKHFFDLNEAWLATVLEQGRRDGELKAGEPPRELARVLVATLEGAMMLARSYGELVRFRVAADRFLGEIVTGKAASEGRGAAPAPRSGERPRNASPAPKAAARTVKRTAPPRART